MSIMQEYDELLAFADMEAHGHLQVETNPIRILSENENILFGLPESFSSAFPPAIQGYVQQHQFMRTIARVNMTIKNSGAMNMTLYKAGIGLAICTLGVSVLPSYGLVQKAVKQIKKILREENSAIYYDLRLEWSLERINYFSNSKLYAILIKKKN